MADGFNFQPYVQPYVAPPIEEFNTLGTTLNERYEKNVEDMTQLELLSSQIQVLPTSQSIKDQMLADVNRTLTGIREKGDIENAASRVREAVRRFAMDPNLRQSAENFQKASQYDEELRQMRLQGKSPLIFQDYRTETFDKDGRVNPITSDNQMKLDYSERYKTLFDQLTPSEESIESSGWGMGPGGIYQQTGRASATGGISAGQIEAIANARLGEYLATDEGIQEMRVLTSDRYNNLTPEQATEQIRRNLIGAGLERVFSKTATSTSAKPLESVGLDREAKQLDMAYKRQQMAKAAMSGKKENETKTGSYIIKASELSDATIGSTVPKSEWMSNKGINSLVDYAFAGKDENKVKGKFELQNVLDNLISSDNESIRNTAENYQSLIKKAVDLLGDKADDYLASALKNGGKDAMLAGLETKLPLEQISELNQEFKKLRSESRGLIFDSPFEDEVEKSLSSPIARNIGWLSPKYIGDESFDAILSAAWGRATGSEQWDLKNFNIVRGDKSSKDLKDTRVSIEGVSNGSIGSGYGIGYLIRDSEGGLHVAVPKETGYEKHLESQFLPTVARVLGADDLVFKNRFKHSVVPGQSKTLEEIATQNNINTFEDLSNIRITGTQDGFKLLSDGKPLTFKEYFEDFSSSDMSPEKANKLFNDAIRAGVVTQEDIKNSMTPSGELDIRALLPKMRESNKPVIFESQYDIYRGYFK